MKIFKFNESYQGDKLIKRYNNSLLNGYDTEYKEVMKKFEDKGDSYWVYTHISNMTPQLDDIQIFEDRESAENFLIYQVNQIATDEQFSDEDLIFTYKDAKEYIDNNEYYINIIEIKSLGRYDLPENLKIGRDAKKYNI